MPARGPLMPAGLRTRQRPQPGCSGGPPRAGGPRAAQPARPTMAGASGVPARRDAVPGAASRAAAPSRRAHGPGRRPPWYPVPGSWRGALHPGSRPPGAFRPDVVWPLCGGAAPRGFPGRERPARPAVPPSAVAEPRCRRHRDCCARGPGRGRAGRSVTFGVTALSGHGARRLFPGRAGATMVGRRPDHQFWTFSAPVIRLIF